MARRKPRTDNDFDKLVRRLDQTAIEPERHVATQLDQAVRDCVLASTETSKESSLTLVIKFKPSVSPGGRVRLGIRGKVTVKTPPMPTDEAVAFPSEVGTLHDTMDEALGVPVLPGVSTAQTPTRRSEAPTPAEAVEAAFPGKKQD